MNPIKNESATAERIKNEELLLRNSSFELPKTVLTIAGHDPTSGAGITSDLKTFQYFGVYGVSVITAVTVQNTLGVISVVPISAKLVEAQLNTLASDIKIDVVKIGMLASEEIVSCVARFVAKLSVPIVLDPIIASSNGVGLLSDNGISVLKRDLFPLVDIITPNLPEASKLTGLPLDSDKQVIKAAERLHEMGAKNILIKGGHSNDSVSSSDLFFDGRDVEWISASRLAKQVHGTGCLLSSSIASLLATGYSMRESVIFAKNFVTEMMENAVSLGGGRELFQHENPKSYDADFASLIIN
jgi:hydroxymethylpyrimidine/phosphomethylpyrimidine kinase